MWQQPNLEYCKQKLGSCRNLVGSLMRKPSIQSAGTSLSSHIFLKRGHSISTVISKSALSAFAGILSGFAALPFLSSLMAYLISSLVSFSQLMPRSMSAGSMSRGFRGTGRFRSSSRCSAHRSSCRSVPRMAFPSLSFTGHSGLLYFCKVSWWCHTAVLCCYWLLLSWPPRPGCQCTALALLFTSLLASVKSSCALAFSALVWLLNTLPSSAFSPGPCVGQGCEMYRPRARSGTMTSVFPSLKIILQSIETSCSFSVKENAVLNLYGWRNRIFTITNKLLIMGRSK